METAYVYGSSRRLLLLLFKEYNGIDNVEGGNILLKNLQYEVTTVNQIRLHVLPTEQFKTFAISVYIGQPLLEETVTSYALIPFVLRRGTRRFPETKRFREHLDELYGAGFGFDVYKRGDYQITQFRMDIIHEGFVAESGSLLQQAIDFLGETIAQPALENGSFRSKYVEDEKVSLRKRLEAIVNDKIRYAAERCVEEMFRGDPYRLHPLGKIADLDSISPESLYSSYEQWLASAPIDIYIVGDTTLDEVAAYVKSAFPLDRQRCPEYRTTAKAIADRPINQVVEKLEVNQGKLNIGLRTNITYAHPGYAAALMYNGILGGYAHSKLFINVREKASLAYYASSRMEGHKGMMTIQSGIEIENYEKALNIIREQLQAMEQGQISELELDQTRAMITNQLREIQDSAFEMISFDFNNVLSDTQRTVSDLIHKVKQIDIQAIRDIAKEFKLDTIYFLRDQGGE